MEEEQLKRKEELCRENLKLIYKIDPHMIRYSGRTSYDMLGIVLYTAEDKTRAV
jgi:hypothetical protein